MGQYVFKLPDVGEGTAEAEIVAWHVRVGDVVKEDAPLVDVMTDKATVEMTAPVAGRIVSLHGEPGDMAPVGGQIVDEPLKRLTEREFEVLQLIAQGLTSAQIAKRINRSIKSVEAYRTAIRSKLGAKSTVDLARLALEYFPTAPR